MIASSSYPPPKEGDYVDIFCRWVYLPLYAILAAISLNEST